MVWFDRIAGIAYPAGMDWLEFNRLMLPQGASLIHASVVMYEGEGVLLLGESGTGKSTHARLWLSHIAGSELLNDDCPAVRVFATGERPRVYGTPWSGKTPCYRNEEVPIRAFVRLKQSPQNAMRRLATLEAFAALQPSFAPELSKEEACCDQIVEIVGQLIEQVPVFQLACLPNREAALLCKSYVYGNPE